MTPLKQQISLIPFSIEHFLTIGEQWRIQKSLMGGCGRVAGGHEPSEGREGVRGWGGGIPLPMGLRRGLGRLCPLPTNFSHFGPQNSQFRRIVGADFYCSAACVTCKHGYVLA